MTSEGSLVRAKAAAQGGPTHTAGSASGAADSACCGWVCDACMVARVCRGRRRSAAHVSTTAGPSSTSPHATPPRPTPALQLCLALHELLHCIVQILHGGAAGCCAAFARGTPANVCVCVWGGGGGWGHVCAWVGQLARCWAIQGRAHMHVCARAHTPLGRWWVRPQARTHLLTSRCCCGHRDTPCAAGMRLLRADPDTSPAGDAASIMAGLCRL
jgi:hypothetical protein